MRRLAVRVAREHSEIVLAEILELVPEGVEEVDLGERVEYAIYGALGEIPSLPDIATAVGGVAVEIHTNEVEEGWEDRWREFHKPLVLGDRLRVRPPWDAPGAEQIDIVVDPGRAFGTGAHPTTRLCLEALLGLDPSGSLLDLGCGSGVIAILAAKLGFGPVLAADNDQLAVDATAVNADVNSVEVAVSRLDLRAQQVPAADVLVANILAPVLRDLCGRLPDPIPRVAILSGLLVHEVDSIAELWTEAGYSEVARSTQGDWAQVTLASAQV
jgi:ribosomal protein L11 methyltransferase